jgi:FkbM family methyltransferase
MLRLAKFYKLAASILRLAINKLVHIKNEAISWYWRAFGKEGWLKYNSVYLYADKSDYVARKIYQTGSYEPRTSRAIKNQVSLGGCVIDVGAHIGHHSVVMRQSVGDEGQVLLFEPNPCLADYLRKTIDYNGWENVVLFEIALTDIESMETLVVPDQKNTGKSSLQTHIENRKKENVIVRTGKLTKILDNEGIDMVNLLKIDIEGGEIGVIRDLYNNRGICKIQTMILELHNSKLTESELRYIYDTLTQSGNVYDITGESISYNSIQTGKQVLIWYNKEFDDP